jgi:peptidoglycan/xylan/chitin deacetylase (PgdA/CDA1 family)
LVTPISSPLRKRLGSSLRWSPRLPGWRERVVVLCYHSVHPSTGFPSSTSPNLFDRHMRWLSEECDLIPFNRAWDERSRPNRSRPAVAVTFDDGFADNHTYALPTLLRHEIPATFFVTTGLIDRVADVIQQRSWRGWSLEGSSLTWGQIIEMQRLGMEIGAHGHRHAVLGRLDDEEVVSDLSMCKQILEERLEASISSIAYPKGRPRRDFSQRTTDLARTVGFENGAAVLFRGVRRSDNRMAIARFVVEDDSLDILRAKVWGKMDAIGLLQERAPMWLLS